MEDIKTRINKLIDGKSEKCVSQIFEACQRTYNRPLPKFNYSIDGQEGEEFEAEDYESAVHKIVEQSGISVWEVEK